MKKLPKGPYQILYADPPWPYKNRTDSGGKKRGDFRKHITDYYPVMTFEDIYSLPISEVASDDALLFLWVVSPNLREGITTGARWGFTFKTIAFVWHKRKVFPGAYTMSSCELCLVFKRGAIPKPRGSRNEKQFLDLLSREASRKPDEVRRRIERMFPTQRKLELFSRCRIEGWDCWGNDCEKFSTKGFGLNLR